MPIIINATPDSDFTNPLGLLRDCHRRVERFLDQLIRVTEEARGGELAPLQREALDVTLRYFQSAAPLHTRDEEDSLFPRLRATNAPEALAALATVEALEADHVAVAPQHEEVERLGRLWLAEGTLPEAQTARLIGLLRGMREMYRRHIGIEDGQLFPVAGRVLGTEDIRAIGREMAARRGVDPDSPSAMFRCAQRRAARQKAAVAGAEEK